MFKSIRHCPPCADWYRPALFVLQVKLSCLPILNLSGQELAHYRLIAAVTLYSHDRPILSAQSNFTLARIVLVSQPWLARGVCFPAPLTLDLAVRSRLSAWSPSALPKQRRAPQSIIWEALFLGRVPPATACKQIHSHHFLHVSHSEPSDSFFVPHLQMTLSHRLRYLSSSSPLIGYRHHCYLRMIFLLLYHPSWHWHWLQTDPEALSAALAQWSQTRSVIYYYLVSRNSLRDDP